jgi:U3 small nucleolar RNA-associated protein 14
MELHLPGIPGQSLTIMSFHSFSEGDPQSAIQYVHLEHVILQLKGEKKKKKKKNNQLPFPFPQQVTPSF